MHRFFRACTDPITGDGDGALVLELVGMRLAGVGVLVGIIFRIGTIHGTIPGALLGAGEDGTIGITGRAGEVGGTAVGGTEDGGTEDGGTVGGIMVAGEDGTAGAEIPMSGCIAVPIPGRVLVGID